MNLTIAVEGTDQVLTIELPPEFEIDDFKAYLESETAIAPSSQVLLSNGAELVEGKTLADWGLEADPFVVLRKKPAAKTPTAPVSEEAFVRTQTEQVRQQFLDNPELQSRLDPHLKDVLNDKELFFTEMRKQMSQQDALRRTQQHQIDQLYKDPDNPENQEKILELIRQQAIEDNMKMAYEESPEAFTRVHMLYINCEVNSVPVKAFVDTGAQMTILSPGLAEKCGLGRLIDKRFQGEAHGVGSAKIQGRIHSAPLKINGGYFSCSFTVVDSSVQMLLGLDMLRRFSATIDLKRNRLVIDDVETEFLPENECPNEIGPSVDSGDKLGSNIFAPDDTPKRVSGPSPRLASSAESSSAKRTKKPTKTTADPAKVDQLVAMGFDKRLAEQALVQTNNNIEMAAGLLFN